MNPLRAAWLGSWKSQWNLERGRRWGDAAWALAAISQAWLLGGRVGRWPRAHWEAKRPWGPSLPIYPDTFEPLPAREWIALLRHGNPELDPDRRGLKETPLTARCWEALLAGDPGPWMALGTVLFDRKTRTRWIPVLGALDPSETLLLPPFLEPLIPASIRVLPAGWWEFLFTHTNPAGTLLPEGSPPSEFPWILLEPEHRSCLEPLTVPELPTALSNEQRDRWAVPLEPGT